MTSALSAGGVHQTSVRSIADERSTKGRASVKPRLHACFWFVSEELPNTKFWLILRFMRARCFVCFFRLVIFCLYLLVLPYYYTATTAFMSYFTACTCKYNTDCFCFLVCLCVPFFLRQSFAGVCTFTLC